jgi:hypothetical protein
VSRRLRVWFARPSRLALFKEMPMPGAVRDCRLVGEDHNPAASVSYFFLDVRRNEITLASVDEIADLLTVSDQFMH